jgi:trehalose/maltose hydrolase-like predicted phosphorylase
MPDEIESVSFQIIWKGQRVSVTVMHQNIVVKNMSDKELPVVICGKPSNLMAGAQASLAY